jgi:hypothetical protein
MEENTHAEGEEAVVEPVVETPVEVSSEISESTSEEEVVPTVAE